MRISTAQQCIFPGCERPLDLKGARGLCATDYHRLLMNGGLDEYPRLAPTFASIDERFFAKVEVTGFCWLWTASLNSRGYGVFGSVGPSRRNVYAHRWAYEYLVGPIPQDLTIDHLCRVPSCVNPDHLEPVTLAENLARKPRLETCVRGHDLANAYVRANGDRMCQLCRKVLRDSRRARRLEEERELS